MDTAEIDLFKITQVNGHKEKFGEVLFSFQKVKT